MVIWPRVFYRWLEYAQKKGYDKKWSYFCYVAHARVLTPINESHFKCKLCLNIYDVYFAESEFLFVSL